MKKTIILFLLFFIILSACIPKSSTVNPNILSQNEPTPRVDTQHVNAEKQYLAVGSEIILEPSISLEAFTIENPVLDNAHITEILKKLQAKFLSQFADAGWYFFSTRGKENYWVHLPSAGSKEFDGFLWTRNYFSYEPGFVFPASIVLPDGLWGMMQINAGLNDYSISEGGNNPVIPTELANLDCFAGNTLNSGVFGHTMLERYLYQLQNPNDALDLKEEVARTFSGWKDLYDGFEVFVLLTRQTYPGVKPRLQSSNKNIEREDIYAYFDLKNGGLIAEEFTYFLQDGSTEKDDLQYNKNLVRYFEMLPPDVMDIYSQAEEKLRVFLSGK